MDGSLLPRWGVSRIVGNVDAGERPDLGELSGRSVRALAQSGQLTACSSLIAPIAGLQALLPLRSANALVDEAAGLAPGRALDVGCGEGADAIWLASQGWRTTGLDVSIVALERARANGAKAGVDVEWLHAGLLDADLLGSREAKVRLRSAGWDDIMPALHRATITSGLTVQRAGAYAPTHEEVAAVKAKDLRLA